MRNFGGADPIELVPHTVLSEYNVCCSKSRYFFKKKIKAAMLQLRNFSTLVLKSWQDNFGNQAAMIGSIDGSNNRLIGILLGAGAFTTVLGVGYLIRLRNSRPKNQEINSDKKRGHTESSIKTSSSSVEEIINSITRELKETEISYISKLKLFKAAYLVPISEKLRDIKSKIMIHHTYQTIQAIDSLCILHQGLVDSLNFDVHINEQIRIVCDSFVCNMNRFEIYSTYSQYYEERFKVVAELQNHAQSKQLHERHVEADIEDWRSLMIAPIQRLPRYLLLMKRLRNHISRMQNETLLNKISDVIMSLERCCKDANSTGDDCRTTFQDSFALQLFKEEIKQNFQNIWKDHRYLISKKCFPFDIRSYHSLNLLEEGKCYFVPKSGNSHSIPILLLLFNDLILMTTLETRIFGAIYLNSKISFVNETPNLDVPISATIPSAVEEVINSQPKCKNEIQFFSPSDFVYFDGKFTMETCLSPKVSLRLLFPSLKEAGEWKNDLSQAIQQRAITLKKT